MRLGSVLLVALALCVARSAHADPTDDFIRAEMKRQNIPGLALAVVKDGVVVKAAGYGVADRATNAPVTPETVFKIASVSKQFMAAGVMVLVQDGRLSLADTIDRHIPDVPAAWRVITIRQLLSHTGGLMREGPGWTPASTSDLEVIRSAYGAPLRSTPGTKWEYSNLGYTIAAEIMTRVSGRPWPEFIADRVFRASGLGATRTTTPERLPGRAVGYSDNDRLRDAEEWSAVRPGGGFMSSVRDLAKWDAVLYGNTVLSEASRREMWSATPLADGTSATYGLGWFVSRPGARRQVWHSGGLPGFHSQMRRYSDDRVTVIVLMNLDDADDDAIAVGVAEQFLPS
jgi:CubicO group peptidase (beta-lactamase class C family)